MTTSTEIREVKCERIIPAPPGEVFDAWLDPKIPGTPFHENEKLIINPKVDGLWYWLYKDKPHYGRFVEFRRPDRIRHTWVSQTTLGEETWVTVTFQKNGEGTLMTLVHSGFTNDAMAQAHDKGWNLLIGNFAGIFGKEKSWQK